MQSLSHAGSSSGIARDIHDIRKMVQTMQLVTAIQNARLSPWCDASSASSAPSTSDFKDALVEVCQLTSASLLLQTQHVVCPVKSILAWCRRISWRCIMTQTKGNIRNARLPRRLCSVGQPWRPTCFPEEPQKVCCTPPLSVRPS